ncbi:MAG: sulfotransferase family 2 domain-containing protein [Pseudomonadota bacterium]
MIDLKHRVIFVHIPKTAGTSVEQYFMQIRGLEDRNRAALGVFKNGKDSDLERGNQHNTLKMYEDFFFGGAVPEDFRIFTVVRDPYKRFWSEWRSRKLPPPMRFPISFYLSVAQFIRLSERPVPVLKDLNSHMRPQVTFTTGQSTDRLRILRFENLADEFEQLCRDWNLPVQPLPRTNEAKRERKPTEAEAKKGDDFVRRFYKSDFETFGYPSQ